MSGPRLSDLPLWERHEQRVLAILRDALDRLRSTTTEGGELELNRELYLCILEVNRENRKLNDLWFDIPPFSRGGIRRRLIRKIQQAKGRSQTSSGDTSIIKRLILAAAYATS